MVIDPSWLCETQIDGVPPLRPTTSLATAFFPGIESVCCPRICSALTRVPFATHATCHPVVRRVSFETLTFAPGVRTVALGGASASTSRVDVVGPGRARDVDERVLAPADPVSPQPEAVRTPASMSSMHAGRPRPSCEDRGDPVRISVIPGARRQ